MIYENFVSAGFPIHVFRAFGMTLADFQVRDVSTTPALMPDARTVVFKSTVSSEKPPVAVAAGDRFLCAASEDTISIYPTDVTSSALPHSVAPSNKKGSLSVHGTRVQQPLLTIASGKEIMAIQLSENNQFLFVFTSGGISYYDLSADPTEPHPIVSEPVKSGCLLKVTPYTGSIVFATGNGKKKTRVASIAYSIEDPRIVFSDEKPVPVNASDFCIMSSHSRFAAIAMGTDEVSLFEYISYDSFKLIGRCCLSAQCGDLMQVFPLVRGSAAGLAALGPEATGIIVHQHEAVSIFTLNSEQELDLLFQFRDAITKQIYTSVDVLNQYVITLSCELFSKRYRVEVFDLSLLKVKAVSLPPIRRWDVSRLVAASDYEEVVKVKLLQGPLLQFLMTGATDTLGSSSTAILWEPVVKDQWFAVMPNFAVLNKNEPYVETEEEFDFNQHADIRTVQASINRYRTTDRVRFNFLPADERMDTGSRAADNEMMDTSVVSGKEPFFPFLQPIESWKSASGEIHRHPPSGNQFKSQFFSDGCRQLLAGKIGQRI